MKKLFLFSALLGLLLSACKGDAEVAAKATEIKMTYEVITSSGKWFGEYFDQTGARAYTNPTELPNGWQYEIKTDKLPFQMYLHATSSSIGFGTPTSPDVTINFYINDKLVKTEKNNWAKGVTSIVYDVK